MRRLATALLFLTAAPALAGWTPCALKTADGEALLHEQQYAKAAAGLEDAVKVCAASPAETSARPFIALGKAYHELHRYKEAIRQFEVGLKREPGLQLAYMDIGASYIELGQYDDAVRVLKKALGADDPHLAMQVNYNIGYAYFSIAAAKNDETDRRSEPYFAKAKDLDGTFGGSYFYLGVLAETARKDRKAARTYYRQGCDRHYAPACQWLAALDQRAAAAPAAPAAAGPTAPINAANAALLTRIAARYRERGVDAKTMESVMANLRDTCALSAPPQCQATLRAILASIK